MAIALFDTEMTLETTIPLTRLNALVAQISYKGKVLCVECGSQYNADMAIPDWEFIKVGEFSGSELWYQLWKIDGQLHCFLSNGQNIRLKSKY